MKIKKSYIDLSKRLRSLDSLNEYCKVMLCDFGITYSPTVATEQELGYYLINEFKLHGFTDYKSYKTGIPFVLDVNYLNYISRFLEDGDSFKVGLNFILGYLETKAELDAMYEFCSSINTSMFSNMYSKNYEVRKIKKVDEFGRPLYTVRDIVSPFNSVQGDVEVVIPITDIYYKWFEQTTGFFGGDGWTFLTGLTRKEEASVLGLILEGHLKPTNKRALSHWASYVDGVLSDGVTVYQELEMFIERSQQGAINSYISDYSPYELKYMNWFEVGFSKKYSIHREYPVYMTNIAWDSVQNRALPIENQLMGIGGEFVYEPSSPQDRPFEVVYHDGSKVILYKREQYSKLHVGVLRLEDYYNALNKETYGYGRLDDRKLYQVTDENRGFLRSALSSLAKKGVYCVNTPKQYGNL